MPFYDQIDWLKLLPSGCVVKGKPTLLVIFVMIFKMAIIVMVFMLINMVSLIIKIY